MNGVPLPMSLEDLERLLGTFLREECHKAGFRRAVVGISGGLDSATVLLLAARALGPENVLAIYMPYRTSSEHSRRDAYDTIAKAGCLHEEIDISGAVDAFAEVAGCDDRSRLGNKMARERMCVLYDRAFRDRALVVGTSNKTELLLGYSTRWGDGAYDLNPIGDLYKGQVKSLAAHLGCPQAVLDKPPTADLWPGQTDEQELGLSYGEIDRVLWYLVDERGAPRDAAARLDLAPDVVRRVLRLVVRTQFKRNLPLLCKVQARTIGIDFRFPRDWLL